MGMYTCNECDRLVDDDWHPCVEDKRTNYELLCPSCAEQFQCEGCGEWIGDESDDDLCAGCALDREEQMADALREYRREQQLTGKQHPFRQEH